MNKRKIIGRKAKWDKSPYLREGGTAAEEVRQLEKRGRLLCWELVHGGLCKTFQGSVCWESRRRKPCEGKNSPSRATHAPEKLHVAGSGKSNWPRKKIYAEPKKSQAAVGRWGWKSPWGMERETVPSFENVLKIQVICWKQENFHLNPTTSRMILNLSSLYVA